MINLILSSIISSFLYNYYLELKDYLIAKKNNKEIINYDELAYESKELKKESFKYLLNNIFDKQQLENLLPIYNIYTTVFRIIQDEEFIDDYDFAYKEVMNEVNDTESKIRRENYTLLKYTLEQRNLDLCGYELEENNVPQSIFYEIVDKNELNVYEDENVKKLTKK